ncbi:uncharacterized protein LOC143576088 [Bidens hawaiensis]|uniref:uncharacterized protein LOC143576088 n=1 Tax=Bidens hawaiensis TaxID=980011 RepID=UPI004048ED77
MAAYCQEIKMLADQLHNVDVPQSQTQLVLKLLGGLTEQYVTIATVIRNKEPLPDFNNCRSQLYQEETERAALALHVANSAATALQVSSNGSNNAPSDQRAEARNDQNLDRGRVNSSSNSRGRGRGRGRGRNMASRGRGSFPQVGYYPWAPFPGMWSNSGVGASQWQQWAPSPPCPYPANSRPNSSDHGVLDSRSSQAYTAGYTPTDIEQALHTMALNPPDEPWFMDTGATNHMTNNPGPQDKGAYPTQQ